MKDRRLVALQESTVFVLKIYWSWNPSTNLMPAMIYHIRAQSSKLLFSKLSCFLEWWFSVSQISKSTYWKKLFLYSFVWHSGLFSNWCHSNILRLPLLFPSSTLSPFLLYPSLHVSLWDNYIFLCAFSHLSVLSS